MSKLPPFTLIYESQFEKSESDTPGVKKTPSIGSAPHDAPAPQISATLQSLKVNPDFRRTLEYTCAVQHRSDTTTEELNEQVNPVLQDLGRQPKVTTVALWDIDSRVGDLPAIITALNEVQPAITFFELQGAPLPAALIRRPEALVSWASKSIGRRLKKSERDEFEDNFNGNEFNETAQIVRQRIGVDYLIGISPYMIAWENEEEIRWNYFSYSQDRVLLVSTYGLREYSKQAGRPCVVGIAMIFTAGLAALMNPRLDYHDGKDTGCLMDHNLDRDNIIRCIRDLKVDDDCLKKFDKKYRDPFLAMLEALRNYTGESRTAPTAPSEPVDNKYWLGELDKIAAE